MTDHRAAPPAPPATRSASAGCSRKEDARFLRGQGNYVDDMHMPGMLHGAILRSPYAHARILSIDTSAAEAHPKVKAVITGAVLETLGLAWMPTLSYDVQAVLATDKVRFQGQEVAFVVAEDQYSARDALELIEVEYETAAGGGRRQEGARPGRAGDPRRQGGQDRQPHLRLGGRRRGRDRRGRSPTADVVVTQDMLYPRVHPAPMETCGSVAYMDPVTGKLTIWSHHAGAARAPHRLRAGRRAARAQDPGDLARTSAAASATRSASTPATCCAIVGSIVTGKPVKWMEDRSENLMSTAFARDYHMHGEIAATRDGKILGLRVDVLADHGAFNGTAQPTKFPAGFFHIFTGSYDLQAAHCKVTGVYTNKAPGGVAYACSFRITEAVYLVERMVDCLADELKMDPAELRLKNLLRPEQFPYTTKTGWEYDSGDYPRGAARWHGHRRLRRAAREQAEKRASAAS